MPRRAILLAAAGLLAGATAAHADQPLQLTPAQMDRVTAGAAGGQAVVQTTADGTTSRTGANTAVGAGGNQNVQTAHIVGTGTGVAINGTTGGSTAGSGVTADRTYVRQGGVTRTQSGISVTVVYVVGVGVSGPGV